MAMPDLARIYTPAFFEEWGPGNETYVSSARVISRVLFDQLRPKRLADVGCGCGVYGHFFRELGAEVVSIDGVLPPPEHRYPGAIHLRDLTEPFENEWGPFDAALCLEVSEHIPEELSGAFLDNLGRFSDTLVLSCAPPNQGGHHHVNERPKRYWVRRLAEKGFAYSRRRTGRLVEAIKRARPFHAWMGHHISIYERADGPIETARMPLIG